MTYFGFLLRFLVPPIIVLALLVYRDRRAGRAMPPGLRGRAPLIVLAAHVLVALIYTTPWDNYLVATGVWWYNPELVTGVTIGWVPIEEYTFFILQPIMTGLLLIWLAPRLAPPSAAVRPDRALRLGVTLTLGILWAAMVVMLVIGWRPGTYLALILAWALPPIMLQTGFGADTLWHHRRLVLSTLALAIGYLAIADAVAINAGTWTISPEQTVGVLLGGILPLEELVFFIITNVLLTFGMTLVMAVESQRRVVGLRLPGIGSIAGHTSLEGTEGGQ
ncbi:MAG: lycopene cyclase domain-containing protein [Anaerolineae bacterium]